MLGERVRMGFVLLFYGAYAREDGMRVAVVDDAGFAIRWKVRGGELAEEKFLCTGTSGNDSPS